MKKIEATDHLADGRVSPVTDRVFPFQTPSLYSGRRSLWKAVFEAERLDLNYYFYEKFRKGSFYY